MPKERIKHARTFATWQADSASVPGSEEIPGGLVSREMLPGDSFANLPSDAKITEDTSLDVSWNRDAEWVQISIEMTPDKWAELAENASGDGIEHYSIYTDVLSRSEINKMIRTLRRARDAAYGVDE